MIRLQLVTLNGMKYDDDVYEVILPTLDGQIGVLTNHMPLISVATTGIISVRKNNHDSEHQVMSYATNGGVIEVADNVLRVLVDEADNPEEINEAEARNAYERAQKMKQEAKDEISLEHAQSLIDRQAVRLQVAQLRHRSTKTSK
jgi:F-type H+-transporting ATPase subunit epsilon